MIWPVCILLLLGACTAASPHPWSLDSISTGEAQFDSSRLVFRSPSSPLQFELLRSGKEVLAFLTLEQHQFSSSEENPTLVELVISIEGEQRRLSTHRRKGGQRLCLLKEMAEPIIFALKEGKSVTLSLDGFQETITPEGWAPLFEKFLAGRSSPIDFMKGL